MINFQCIAGSGLKQLCSEPLAQRHHPHSEGRQKDSVFSLGDKHPVLLDRYLLLLPPGEPVSPLFSLFVLCTGETY